MGINAAPQEHVEVPEGAHPGLVEVRSALRAILKSQPFRTSKQCQDLLRYVVERTLSGTDASLRERIIGVEVFGRQPTYDTSEDPVVRVRAADVRKRLAQYYQSLGFETPVFHIELLPGSYKVSFRNIRPFPAAIAEPEPPLEVPTAEIVTAPDAVPVSKQRPWSSLRRISWLRLHPRWSWAAVLTLGLIAVTGSWRWIQFALPNPQESFWAPMFSAKQPVLLYLGSNATYILSSEYLAKYRDSHGLANNGPEFYVDFLPGDTVRAADLVPVRDTFVTVGDVAAATQLTTVMTAWRKPFVMRSGRDINFADLRNRPSVMIGAFNNPWTLELTRNLPFYFAEGNRIQDRDHPERAYTNRPSSDDYSLITRVLVSKTGGPLLTVAGIGQCGTQAAAEFLASPERMRELLKDAPPGWKNKNMQVVLHVKVLGYNPVSVEVVAASYW